LRLLGHQVVVGPGNKLELGAGNGIGEFAFGICECARW
jgi:hypothetical protein